MKQKAIKGYNSIEEIKLDLLKVKDLSKREDVEIYLSVLYKIYSIKALKCPSLIEDILDSIQVVLTQFRERMPEIYTYFEMYEDDDNDIEDFFNLTRIAVSNGVKWGNFKQYISSYEKIYDTKIEQITLTQLSSLKSSCETFSINNNLNSVFAEIQGYINVHEINQDLNNISDLSNDKERYLFNMIVYKIMKLYDYKQILSDNVYLVIKSIVGEHLKCINGLDYYTNLDIKSAKSIECVVYDLITKSEIMSSILLYNNSINYITCENQFGIKIKELSVDELLMLQTSAEE